MKIDISTSVITYTTEDLIRYARQGLLYAGDYCLSDLVQEILDSTDNDLVYSEEEYQNAKEEARQEGFDEAVDSMKGFLENM